MTPLTVRPVTPRDGSLPLKAAGPLARVRRAAGVGRLQRPAGPPPPGFVLYLTQLAAGADDDTVARSAGARGRWERQFATVGARPPSPAGAAGPGGGGGAAHDTERQLGDQKCHTYLGRPLSTRLGRRRGRPLRRGTGRPHR